MHIAYLVKVDFSVCCISFIPAYLVIGVVGILLESMVEVTFDIADRCERSKNNYFHSGENNCLTDTGNESFKD